MNIGNEILIKQSKPEMGRDTKTFRAYATWQIDPNPSTSLNVSCTCTGNAEHGALNCAAKAFIKYIEPKAEFEEIMTRIKLTVYSPRTTTRSVWLAELQPKEAK